MSDLFANLAMGTFSGVVASVLTLIGDRWLHRTTLERRLRTIAGDYGVSANTPGRDTSGERVTIELVAGRRFSIMAAGGPTGDWRGHFIVHPDFLDAHGVYRYLGSSDWGQHELLSDRVTDSILVYGVNRSKPGLLEPFSLLLSKVTSPPSRSPNNELQRTKPAQATGLRR
jgi:hypothetical protein